MAPKNKGKNRQGQGNQQESKQDAGGASGGKGKSNNLQVSTEEAQAFEGTGAGSMTPRDKPASQGGPADDGAQDRYQLLVQELLALHNGGTCTRIVLAFRGVDVSLMSIHLHFIFPSTSQPLSHLLLCNARLDSDPSEPRSARNALSRHLHERLPPRRVHD